MFQSKLGWIDGQWNPITGCFRKECEWCVSRRYAARSKGDYRLNLRNGKYHIENGFYVLDEAFTSETGSLLSMPFGFEPTYHKYRMNQLDLLKGTRNLLVCGEGEMFGPWVPEKYITEIFDTCRAHPKNHYLFLTAYPERYHTLARKGLLPDGDGFWYGASYTKGFLTEAHTYLNSNYHRFLAVMPIMGPAIVSGDVEWVIIGADSRRTSERIIPDESWITDLVGECRKQGIKAFTDRTTDALVPEEYRQHDIPELLQKKLPGDKRDLRISAECPGCKKKYRKNEMVSISVRRKRHGQTKTLMHLCEDCFSEMKAHYGVEEL